MAAAASHRRSGTRSVDARGENHRAVRTVGRLAKRRLEPATDRAKAGGHHRLSHRRPRDQLRGIGDGIHPRPTHGDDRRQRDGRHKRKYRNVHGARGLLDRVHRDARDRSRWERGAPSRWRQARCRGDGNDRRFARWQRRSLGASALVDSMMGNLKSKLFLVLFVVLVSSWFVGAQEGHPLTGTWTGDVGSRHVTLAIDWDGKNVTGTINPGPDASKITSVRIDPAMWSIHLEADGKTHVVLDGGLSNIGSASRTLTGTWTEGGTKTPITLTRVDSQSASSNSGELPASPAYDGTRRMTLRGTVTSLEWINPRARFV